MSPPREYPNFLALLRLLGTEEQVVWQTDKLITLLKGDELGIIRLHRLPPPLHLVPSLLRISHVSLADKVSNARAVWLSMRIDEQDVLRLDAESAQALLRKLHVSQDFLDWFWKTTSLALMNVPLAECSAGALLRFHAQLIGHNDYRIGFPAAGLSELFLAESVRVIERNGGAILTSRRARRFLSTGDACEGVELEDGKQLRARTCVAALPPAELWELLTDAWRARDGLRAAASFQPSPYISVYLWFDRKLTSEKFWARVWSPSNLNCDFYDLANIRAGWSERNSVIASNIIYSKKVAHWSDADVVATTVREIAALAPEAAEARILHARVHRIPMSIPCPYPGTEGLRPPTETGVKGLLLAGDWTRTHLPCSMESAVRSGFLAAEAIWRGIGKPRRLALTLPPTTGFSGLAFRLAHMRRSSA